MLKPHQFITDRSKALGLLWFSFACLFQVQWPSFRKELLARLTVICSLCILTTVFVILVISRFAFDSGFWDMISTVPGYCLFVTFCKLFFFCK